MDKNAIRKFAVWAREELIARVSQRALSFEITEEAPGDPRAVSVNGHLLTDTERKQRAALIARIRKHGYKAVMEEAAYTWFNRFCALRFMEVNGFLPTRIRVFTDEENGFHPQILTEAIHMELDGLDMERVYQLKSDSKEEELYKYLLITQCNALCDILPGMFTPIADYTGLLLPDNLLRKGSVIDQMIALIPEEDWLDQVQIIGWLYQYYNAVPKDEVFANLKKNIKISKHDIPAATQLFTPDWIVRYMVENSLGRLWVEGHPDEALKAGWKYYLEETEQEPQVQEELSRIRAEYAQLKPEDIKCIDPCMGSGHILVYMFDVLLQIYQAYGYSTREAVQSILQNNLYGLDIDDRAAQLAYFAVMMKARQVDRRFLTRTNEDGNPDIPQPHVRAIAESGDMPKEAWTLFGPQQDIARRVYAAFVDAKEYGSLIEPDVTLEELDVLDACLARIEADFDTCALYELETMEAILAVMPPLAKQARMLVQKYDVVVTNPPYMNSGSMNETLSIYLQYRYPFAKYDMFAVFAERCRDFNCKSGFFAMITQQAWLYLSTYEKFRKSILDSTVITLLQLGPHAFADIGGEIVQTVAYVMSKQVCNGYCGNYERLVDYDSPVEKETAFLEKRHHYICTQSKYAVIPGHPIAYWVSDNFIANFRYPVLGDIAKPRSGLSTNDNARFLRMWYEIDRQKFFDKCASIEEAAALPYKWFPYNKGGQSIKWYGNFDYVVNWENDGEEIKYFATHNPKDPKTKHWSRRASNYQLYFRRSITWSLTNGGAFAARIRPQGSVFDMNGMSLFCSAEDELYILSLMCSKPVDYYMNVFNPTLANQAGDIAKIPYIESLNSRKRINALAKDCIDMCKVDWDSFETSWDFQCHPLLQYALTPQKIAEEEANGFLVMNTIEDAYRHWAQAADERFYQLKANEEELNRIFIDIYGLQDELTPEVEDKDVTVRRADLGRDIRSFISYAVGCMFGRYSLSKPGLAYAGGAWDDANYTSPFKPDRDGILPICDDEYFDDDIVGRFVQFVKTVFGSGSLEENLRFIAKALGGNGTPRQVIRSYFLNDFYADHLKIYQKRPIYWLFDSGKKNGFKCLIYMHRYAPDTIARIRTDYVHEQQSRYRTAIADLEKRVASASTAERVKLQKQLTKVTAQADELRAYEEKIHHLADQMIAIDLDDGVKVNYARFGDVLAKIK